MHAAPHVRCDCGRHNGTSCRPGHCAPRHRWVWDCVREGLRLHDHARCAIAALRSLFSNESLLQLVGLAVCSKPRERGDGLAVGSRQRDNTAAHGVAIDQHGATAALGQATAKFLAVQVEVVRENLQQRFLRRGVRLDTLAIELETDQSTLLNRWFWFIHPAGLPMATLTMLCRLGKACKRAPWAWQSKARPRVSGSARPVRSGSLRSQRDGCAEPARAQCSDSQD